MMRTRLEGIVRHLWYGGTPWYRLLLPLAWLYCAIAVLRRLAYRGGLFKSTHPGCRVIVVGNLVAGGGGKTPVTIALVRCLQRADLRVGVLCSGYRGCAKHWPQPVDTDSDPHEVGDEAVLLAQRTGAPVMAGRKRVDAARALLQAHECDVLVCDDGLQHYALERDLEIVVTYAARGFGNGACLPAGPLREPRTRLRTVDAVLCLEGTCEDATAGVRLDGDEVCRLDDPGLRRPLTAFAGETVQAVTGIADPQRFFDRLRAAGIAVDSHTFDDHHRFVPGDLPEAGQGPILMTEKDAVKCRFFARPDCWYLPIEAWLDPAFENRVIQSLDATKKTES